MCPHTTTHVSSYYYICVLIQLHMCPHTTIYVSSYYYTCVLILLYMCPHTTIHASSRPFVFVCVCVCILRACAQSIQAQSRLLLLARFRFFSPLSRFFSLFCMYAFVQSITVAAQWLVPVLTSTSVVCMLLYKALQFCTKHCSCSATAMWLVPALTSNSVGQMKMVLSTYSRI
jgi:hypothetical protein